MATKEERLRAKFAELDTDGNGTLDFEELKDLLQKGNPNMKSNEIRKLYNKCDSNHDGKIEFDEFLAYVYGQDVKHGNLQDDTEKDWGPCQNVFLSFCHHGAQEMEGKEWAKFVKDNHLLGKGFVKTDIDLIFSKVVTKGKRKIDFEAFKQAIRHVALKKHMTNGEMQDKVSSCHGPELHGTKQDAVRFYDDKTTFTGAACANENFGVEDDGHRSGDARHAKQQAEAKAKLEGGKEMDWGAVEKSFNAFAGPGAEVDGKELLKLCEDCKLLGGGLTKQDVDIVFSGVARKAKKVGFELFKDIVRKIADKKKKEVQDIQEMIAKSDGPVIHATQAQYSRFHDDKTTYTGSHTEDHHDGRHEKLAEAHKAATAADDGERPWEPVKEVYAKFAGTDGLDSREFMKFCKDANLICKDFNAQCVDIVFSSVVPKGQRRLYEDAFIQAIREIAVKKGVPTHKVQGAVASCDGPVLKGTETQYNRFHDDKTTYTGMHTDK